MWLSLRSQWEGPPAPPPVPVPVTVNALGQPVHGGNTTIEPLEDRMRLHLQLFVWRFARDPHKLRFVLWSPKGESREEWWPGSPYLHREDVGHFTVDLAPVLIGRWTYRFDSWGPVSTVKTGGFVMEMGGSHTMRWTEMGMVHAVLPPRPLLVAA